MSQPNDTAAGAAIGGLLGFFKAFTLITAISWAAVFDTALLSAVGAMVGFGVTLLLKFLKRKITGK
jgi:hypothetical protein